MRLYTIDADGGPVRQVAPQEQGSQGYAAWSPDGKKLFYGIMNTSTREEVYIRAADIDSGKVTRVDATEGLFAPRWSPDGATLAALQWSEQRHLMLFHVKTGKWQEIQGRRLDWPTWNWDSKSLFGKSGDSLVRYRLDANTFEVITELKPEEMGGYWRSIGVGSDGSAIRVLNRDNRQVYALQFEEQ